MNTLVRLQGACSLRLATNHLRRSQAGGSACVAAAGILRHLAESPAARTTATRSAWIRCSSWGSMLRSMLVTVLGLEGHVSRAGVCHVITLPRYGSLSSAWAAGLRYRLGTCAEPRILHTNNAGHCRAHVLLLTRAVALIRVGPDLPAHPGFRLRLQAWTEALKGVRGRLAWQVYATALGASACHAHARTELAVFVRLLASGVRPPCVFLPLHLRDNAWA